MTIREKADLLYNNFLAAWEDYKKIENAKTTSTGFQELLIDPELKTAYKKWQAAVSDYFDFMQSVEKRHSSEALTGS